MPDHVKGVAALVVACTIWGLSPLFYALLTHVPPIDVLAFRGLWSLVFFAAVLAVQGRLSLVGQALAQPRLAAVTLLAAVMISVNWFGYIFAIQAGLTMEAALGYYIFPLMAVLLGRLIWGEALYPAQWVAVALAATAVSVLTWGLGVAPWIALGLATSFSIYGLLKKRLPLGPVVSVTAEVALLAPLALGWLLWQGTAPTLDVPTHLLLAISGPLTALPLILFSFAAKRVRLSTVGIIQFLNPTLQFACAVVVLGEAFTLWHGIAFPLIWLAVLIYALRARQADRVARKARASAGTS